MTWFGFILRNIVRRPGRSFFTLLGVALAVGSYLTLAGLSHGMDEGAQASLKERSVDLVVSRRGVVEVFGGTLPQTLQARIDAAPGVAASAAELGTLLQIKDTQAVVLGWGEDQFEFKEIKLRRGSLPRPGQGQVVIGQGLADALRLDIGSEVLINFQPLHVAGIADFDSATLRGVVVMPLTDMQALLAQPGQVTLFNVRVKDAGSEAALAATEKAIAALGPNVVVARTDVALRSIRAFAMMGAASLAIGIVALAMASLSVLNTLAMTVEERTREIGVFGAIGWSRPRILSAILSEGLVLAAVGGVVGIGIGYAGAAALSAAVLPGSGLSASTSAWLALESEIAALIVGALGGLWPAWRASRLSPALALHHQ